MADGIRHFNGLERLAPLTSHISFVAVFRLRYPSVSTFVFLVENNLGEVPFPLTAAYRRGFLVFRSLRFCFPPLDEIYATGIPRILRTYEGADKQPVFNPSGNFFMLTLPNQNYVDPVNDPVKIEDDRLGDLELLILQAIQQNPGISTKNLLNLIKEKKPEVTLDILKNSIKRKLHHYIEFLGA